MPDETCQAIVDSDDEDRDVVCGDEAVFMCCDEPRCDQCAHDWLDELSDDGREHTVRVINRLPDLAVLGRAEGEN